MVGTKENDFGFVAAASFHIENCFSTDDAWVIKMDAVDFVLSILPKGISDVFVTHGHRDIWLYVFRLHNGSR